MSSYSRKSRPELNTSQITESSDPPFECPSWAGKPPEGRGFYLDVVKNETVIKKLLLDEKSYYLFGRHLQICDFPLEHASISRFHAVIIYHQHLDRIFIMDLGSTHGTFLGSFRLDHHQPQALPVDTTIIFGQSTRGYVLRERKQILAGNISIMKGGAQLGKDGTIDLIDSAGNEEELDDLTQYNTALNKIITTPNENKINNNNNNRKRGSSKRIVFASQLEEVINPEDVDPTIGRFRNMVQTAFIPVAKKQKIDIDTLGKSIIHDDKFQFDYTNLRQIISGVNSNAKSDTSLYSGLDDPFNNNRDDRTYISSISSITAAPPVEDPNTTPLSPISPNFRDYSVSSFSDINDLSPTEILPNKKKYAKEAWPGKKTTVQSNFFAVK